MEYDSIEEYSIEKGVNYITIELPAIDDSFFQTYYIKGDYARVVNDTITWKGEKYIKEK